MSAGQFASKKWTFLSLLWQETAIWPKKRQWCHWHFMKNSKISKYVQSGQLHIISEGLCRKTLGMALYMWPHTLYPYWEQLKNTPMLRKECYMDTGPKWPSKFPLYFLREKEHNDYTNFIFAAPRLNVVCFSYKKVYQSPEKHSIFQTACCE